jgi:hypothetical protein
LDYDYVLHIVNFAILYFVDFSTFLSNPHADPSCLMFGIGLGEWSFEIEARVLLEPAKFLVQVTGLPVESWLIKRNGCHFEFLNSDTK